MYILGLNGSPRKGGNTDVLLDKLLEGAAISGSQTEKVILNQINFSPCQECANMRDDGTCLVDDGLQPVYQKLKQADAIVLASPIFFGSLSAQSKMFIDRFQCQWRVKYILGKKDPAEKKKKGIFLSVEASTRDDFFANARSIVKNLFATVNAEYFGELFCSGVDDKGAILKREQCLKKAFDLGKQITKRG